MIKKKTTNGVLEGEVGLQSTVAALLLLTSGVILSCIVVDYAVNIFQSALQTTDLPQLERLRSLQNSLLNQTDAVINQTQTLLQQDVLPNLPQNLTSSNSAPLP